MKMLCGSSSPKHFFNPIEVREDKKGPLLTSFSPVTSTNKEISPKNFMTVSSDSFTTLLSKVKVIASASPKLLNLNQDYSSKKCFFWSNPYKIEIMITSLIEMLELPNVGHMTTSTI